jgi:hypothetical protein
VQLGGYVLVRPADMTEESLRHEGSPPPCFAAGVTASMPSRAVANQVHCLWRRDGDVHARLTSTIVMKRVVEDRPYPT